MASNKKLSAIITIGGTVAGSLKTAFGSVDSALSNLGKTIGGLERRQKLLGKAIQEFGRAGKDVDGLRSTYTRLSDQIDRTRKAQERLNKAAEFKTKAGNIAGGMKSAAVTVGAAGVTALAPIGMGIKEAKRQQQEIERARALGFSKEDSDYLLKAAEGQKAFGVSTRAATHTVAELASAFGDVHHATEALPQALRQRFALGLYDSEHGTNLAESSSYAMARAIEARNGTKDMAEYAKQANMAHQLMVSTKGRVNGDELRNALSTGGISVKSMSDEALYYGSAHLMQEMGGDSFGTATMSLYQGLAQGRITKRAANNLQAMGMVAPGRQIKHDKSGQISFLNPGDLLGYDTFVKDQQAWVEQYFIPMLKKRGIDPDDMTKVAEVAGQIVSNRKGADMLATRVAQRGVIAKEAANVRRADNIDQSYERNKGTATGKEVQAEARLADLKLRIGTQIMPIYISALEKTASILEAVNKFADENPTAFKIVATSLAAIGTALVVAAPLLVVAAGALQTIALIRLASTVAAVGQLAGVTGQLASASTAAAGGLGGFLGKLGMVGLLSTAALGVAKAAGLPDVDAEKGRKEFAEGNWWAASTHLPAGEFLSSVWGSATGSSKAATGPSAPYGVSLPQPAAAGTRGGLAGVYNDNSTTTIQVTQQPGEDAREFARRVAAENERQRQVRQRRNMYDGASQ